MRKLFLKFLMWLLPLPQRIGEAVSSTGDTISTTSAKVYFDSLRELARIEGTEGRING